MVYFFLSENMCASQLMSQNILQVLVGVKVSLIIDLLLEGAEELKLLILNLSLIQFVFLKFFVIELNFLLEHFNHLWGVKHQDIIVHFLEHSASALGSVSYVSEVFIKIVEHEISYFIPNS